METVIETKASTTLAAYLDLEDEKIEASKTATSCPICRCSRNFGRDCSTIPRPPKQTLYRMAKAVVFGTILIKRVRERKRKSDGRKQSLSLDSGSLPTKEDEKLVKRELVGLYKENRDKQLVSSYSVPCGSSQSFPISISEPKISNNQTSERVTSGVRRRDGDRRSCYALSSGVGFLVVSFGVTVMQGRVIAIWITLMWLYFYAWMHMEDRWVDKKPTKFTETEMTSIYFDQKRP